MWTVDKYKATRLFIATNSETGEPWRMGNGNIYMMTDEAEATAFVDALNRGERVRF